MRVDAPLVGARLDEFLQPTAILTNGERVTALRSALTLLGAPAGPWLSEPNTPGEVAELEARLARVLAQRRATCTD